MGDGLKPELAEWLTERTLVGESFLAPLAAAFSRHEAKLTRYAARITGDADAARDVVQDVFARLCREPPVDLNGHLAPWLYAACRNRAIDVRRKESRMILAAKADFFAIADGASDSPSVQRGSEVSAPTGLKAQGAGTARSAIDPSTHAATKEQSAKVLEILAQLPASQQEAVCLRFSCGLSYKEIAAVMELSVSHVGVLLHTAIAALRELMKDVS